MMDRRANRSERRRALRVPATFAVLEEGQSQGQGQPQGSHLHLCQAEDIAPGGITIKHPKDQDHQPNTEVALRFALPGSTEEIEARGEIVSDSRVGRFRRTGVRFIALRPEHQQLIAAFCRRRRGDEARAS